MPRVQCSLPRVIVVYRVLQQIIAFGIHRIASAFDRGAQSLVNLLQLSAAERKRQIGQRVHQFFARRGQLLLGAPCVARHSLQQVVPIRQSAADRDAPAAQHAADERQFLRHIAQRFGHGVVGVFLLRLKRRHIACRSTYAQLHKVRQLISGDVAHGVVQDAQRVKRWSASDEIFVDFIVQPCAEEELEQRHCQRRQPLLLVCARHILEEIAQLVVDLQLELREDLRQWIAPIEQCRRGAFAAVSHHARRPVVRLRHGGSLAHPALQVLVVPRTHQTSGGKLVDILHRRRHGGRCFLCPCPHQRVAALTVGQEGRRIHNAVVFFEALQRLPHAAQQFPTVKHRASLRQRDEVGQPRCRVNGHHVGSHAALQSLHKVVHVSAQRLLHVAVCAALLVGQQVCVLLQLHHEVRQCKPPVFVDAVDLAAFLFLCQPRVGVHRVHLLADALVAGAVSCLCRQRPQLLDVVRLIDDIRYAFYVSVEAFHRVIGRVKAKALLCVSKPLDARSEGVCQAVNGGGQRRHLCVDTQRPAEQSHDAVAVTRLEMWEVAAAVVHRLVPVAYSGLVHLLEQLVVDAAELLHRVLDLCLVQLRVLRPHILHDAAPVAQRLAVPLRHAPSAVLQHPDVVHRFAQQLHGVCFRDFPLLLHSLRFFGAQVQCPYPLAHFVLQSRGLCLCLVHRCEILCNDLLRQLFVLHDVKDIALHRLAGIEITSFLVLPVVCCL